MDRKLTKLLTKARANADKGKFRAALKYYQKACDHAPRDPLSWQELGALFLANQNTTEGLDALFRAADLYAQVGAADEAGPLCEQVLAIDPSHDGANNVRRVIERRTSLRRLVTSQPIAQVPGPPQLDDDSPNNDDAPRTAQKDSQPAPPDQADSLPAPKDAQSTQKVSSDPPQARVPTQPSSLPPTNPPARPPPPPSNVRIVQACASSSPLLQQLGEDLVNHLAQVAKPIHLAAGDIVFSQGDVGASLYLVVDGIVEVIRIEGDRQRIAALLKTGSLFGEMALLGGPPRTATVRAERDSTLLEISQQTVRELIRRDARVLKVLIRFFRERMVDNLIATSPFLSHLTVEQRRSITSRFRVCDLPANQVVIKQSEPSNGLYLVLAGHLSVWATGVDEKSLLGRLGPGDVFGEMALLKMAHASATVRADERVWLLRLPAQDFETLMDDHPTLRGELGMIAKVRQQHNKAILE